MYDYLRTLTHKLHLTHTNTGFTVSCRLFSTPPQKPSSPNNQFFFYIFISLSRVSTHHKVWCNLLFCRLLCLEKPPRIVHTYHVPRIYIVYRCRYSRNMYNVLVHVAKKKNYNKYQLPSDTMLY